MKKNYLLFLFFFITTGAFSQTTVFTDDFSSNQSATYTTAGAIGASAWSVTTGGTAGQDFGSRRNTTVAQLELTNDATAATNQNGWNFTSTPTTSFTAPYNSTLNANTGLITWTFNMRQIRPDPAGFASGSYGVAFILAGSGANGAAGTSGYAVALGQSGTLDPIRLLKFNNGMQGTIANIITSNTAGLTDFGVEYLSIKVTYLPSTDTWELFLRNDGTTAFTDPTTGTLVSQGTAVDNTFTGISLGFMGGYWQGSTAATQTAFFDNTKVTVAAGGTPTINVTPATLSGFLSTAGVPTAEQNYAVDGSNLTANIVITPPVGFEITTTSGSGYVSNPSTINLSPTAGTVASTPIYVRMNSSTLGVNTGNITHTSTGATQKDVALSGKVLAAEPTVQSTISAITVTNSTVLLNFGGGNGARRIVLAKLAAPVSTDPVDGTTYTANANFGAGTQIGTGNYVVYDGTGNAQLVTGLTAGATYHFAVYDYNNGGVSGAENYLIPGGVTNATLLTYSVPYVWIGLNGDWQVPTNWLPTRLFPATNDSLLFTSASINDIITNVPTQTVGYMGASLLTGTTLQAAANGNVLTIGNLTGTDFYVQSGSSFNINTANGLTLNLVTGATASISGSMTFTAGAHKLTAVDANAITFNSGAVFLAGIGFTGNAFGPSPTATANSVIFANGSTYRHVSGGNPFALGQPASVVIFQTGSLFRLESILTPSVSGRTYANFELDVASLSPISATGAFILKMDNLTVTNGSITFGMTGGFDLKGNVSVAATDTLHFTPTSAASLTFNGTTAQSISNAGTLTFGANQDVVINNAAGVTLNTPITLQKTLTFTSGLINTSTLNLLTLTAAASVSGASDASFVNGPVSKIGNTPFIFPIGKTNTGPSGTVNGYAAVEIGNFTGGAVTDQYTAEYVHSSGRALGPISAVGLQRVSGCDYWTLNRTAGTSTVDITLHWNDPVNNCTTASPYINNLPSLTVAHFNGTSWDAFGVIGTYTGTNTTGTITWSIPQSSAFGVFTIGSVDFNNPLPIIINYFTGTKSNGNHLLNWKVTCVSVPSATIEVERSTDGRNYSSIYSIFATALRCQQPFSYTDNQPAKGTNYYRLKMTDADGKVTYSTVVPLINADKGFDISNIAPNPVVNSSFNLQISSAEKTQLELLITDMQGRIVQRQTISVVAGFNTIPMNVKNLAAGTYQLFGNTADERTRVLRFVIQ